MSGSCSAGRGSSLPARRRPAAPGVWVVPRYDLLDDLPRFFRQEKQPRRKKWPERLSGFCRAAPAAGPGAGTAGGLGRIRTAGADDQHPGAVPGGGFPAGVHRAHRRCLRPERRRGGGVSGVALAGGGLLGRGRVAAAALLRAVQLAGLPRVFRGGGGVRLCAAAQRRGPPLCRGGAETVGRAAAVRAAAVSGYIEDKRSFRRRSWAGETASARCMP